MPKESEIGFFVVRLKPKDNFVIHIFYFIIDFSMQELQFYHFHFHENFLEPLNSKIPMAHSA